MGLVDDCKLGSIALFLPDEGRVDSSADTVGKYQRIGISASLAVGYVAGRETGCDDVESHSGVIGSQISAVNAFVPVACLVEATSRHQIFSRLGIGNRLHQSAMGDGSINSGSLGSMAGFL